MKLAVAEIQDFPEDHWSDFWKTFPHGTCGDSSELLAIYLHEIRGVERERIEVTMAGRLPCWQSHAWNFVDGYYVDITASQFEGQPELIFRRHSPWHERFKGYYRRPYRVAIDSLQHVADLRHRRMLKQLMRHHQSSR